jgi:hypothetical protein
VKSDLLMTPRPVPGKLLPAAGAVLVLLVALPVFLVADWPLKGWALGALLWVAVRGIGLLAGRVRASMDSLASSGVQGFELMFKALVVLVVLVATAASDADVALAALLVFALAYTFELGLSVAAYFGTDR